MTTTVLPFPVAKTRRAKAAKLPAFMQKPKPHFDLTAVNGRAEHLVYTVKVYFADWADDLFDEKRAARFLDCVRAVDATDPSDDLVPESEEFRFMCEWLHDHNQSLDWLLRGDPMLYVGKWAEWSKIARDRRVLQTYDGSLALGLARALGEIV